MKASNVVRIKGEISNVYLINEKRICIVDCGSPNDFKLIEHTVEKVLGRSMYDVDYILPTHSHVEHLGNAPKLKRKTGALVVLPDKGINPAKGSFDSIGFLKDMPAAIIAGLKNNPALLLYPHLNFVKATADVVSSDGMRMPGHEGWNVLHTPGHSPESVCLYHSETDSLISGDTIITIDGKAALPFGIWNRTKMKNTIERLKKLRPKRLFPGHGDPLEGDGLLDQLTVESKI
jgi:glyoxylase-like metal-dependent hydrolase (beta-lactamase superfamily II)